MCGSGPLRTMRQGTVEKVSPPPEDVARLYRAINSNRGSREIGSLTAIDRVADGTERTNVRTAPRHVSTVTSILLSDPRH